MVHFDDNLYIFLFLFRFTDYIYYYNYLEVTRIFNFLNKVVSLRIIKGQISSAAKLKNLKKYPHLSNRFLFLSNAAGGQFWQNLS